jgi:hypothetical protein
VPQLLASGQPESILRNQVSSWSFLLQARLQVLDEDNHVLADSGVPENLQKLVVSNLPGPGVSVSSDKAGADLLMPRSLVIGRLNTLKA